MFSAIREYTLPVLLALLVHVAAGASLWGGLSPAAAPERELIRPHAIRAELMVMAPQPPAARRETPSQPDPVAVQREAERERAREQAEREAEREAQRRAAERREEEARREAERREAERREAERQAERERQARLDELAASSFDRALESESESLARRHEAEVAQSYTQGIYQLVVQNWSRPASARSGMEALLRVELVPTGEVVGVTVLESSGDSAFDRSAEQAVRRAGQFEVPQDSRIFENHFRRIQLLFRPEDLLH